MKPYSCPTISLDNVSKEGKIQDLIPSKEHKVNFAAKFLWMTSSLFNKERLQVKQKKDGIFISQDKYVDEILKKFRFTEVKTASTPMETQKPLLKDEDGEEVDVHIYRYLKGQPKLGLWYPKDSPFDLVAYTDSDYAGCKKQTVVANSTTEAEYVAASSCCGKLYLILLGESKEKHNLLLRVKVNAVEVPQPSDPIENVADEVVHKELGDSLCCNKTTTDDDGDITLAQALIEMKSTKPKNKGVVIQEIGESTITISSQQSHDKGKGILMELMKPMKKKDQIRRDEETALKL
ncbi:hypothetical protein Tco_0523413 [Tanacetum coccineum]